MVENEGLAEQVLPERRHDEDQVRRIARLHGLEADLEVGPDRQDELPEQRR